MGYLPQLLVVGLVLVGVWIAFQPRYAFVVRIQRGVPRTTRGKVTASFLQQVEEVCQRNGVQHGWLGGVRRGQRIALVFSRQIPMGCQQQLRNEWLLSG